MIKSNSPYYITTPFVSPASGLTCVSYTLSIQVWNGAKATPTGTPYTITKNNPTSSTGSDKINIARIVNDYIEFTPQKTTTTSVIDGNNQQWVKTSVTYVTTSAETTPQEVVTSLMSLGYTYGNEGENVTTITNNTLIPTQDYKVNREGVFVVPILLDEDLFYGAELVTNGGFTTDSDWTKGSAWFISGGFAFTDGSSSSANNLVQNSVVQTGKIYLVKYTISNLTNGSVKIIIDGSSGTSLRSTNGVFTDVLTAAGGDGKLYIQAHNYNISNIDNISVREVINTTLPLTVISYPNNEINLTTTAAPTTDSSEMVKNIWVKCNETTTDSYIEVVFNGKTTTLLLQDEPKYTPIDVFFQNKEGAEQVLTFFKEQNSALSVTSSEFESDRGQPSAGNHQFIRYNVQARKSLTLNSGFVDEEMNEIFTQLLLSERIWSFENDTFTPLNIKSKDISYKTQLNERLINYEMKFDYSYNEINNV